MDAIGLSIIAVLVALALSILIGINATRLGYILGLLDFPDPLGGRKRHEQVTPLIGGTAIILSVLAAMMLTYVGLARSSPALDAHLGWLATGVSSLYLIGLMDDRFALGPKIRLTLAVTVLLLVVLFAPDFSVSFIRFSGFKTTFVLGAFADAFTLLCLVGLLNAVNMADGKNGLVISLCLLWSCVLILYAPSQMLPLMAATMTALAVMFWFNMRGRLFLGDGGSYGLSALFGLLAIYIYNHSFADVRADHIAMLFAIPIFDTIRLMAVRVARGRSPFSADRDHLHHHLAYRWGWPRGLCIYLALSALPNLLTWLMPEAALGWLVLAFTAYAIVLGYSSRNGRFVVDSNY